MTIRFAPAWGGKSLSITRALCRSVPLGAVNDNCRAAASPRIARKALAAYSAPLPPARKPAPPANDAHLLGEALRHFARHGLSAATHARAHAEAAYAAGDPEACNRWIAICRQFDRRIADALDRDMATAC